ncbi:MAG: hypothetical protein JSV91_11765 [Phycisphaerales bacterium]|nr:MAG: hypothetical protein JSV91_11765 [Phycisphaerales bacterium]
MADAQAADTGAKKSRMQVIILVALMLIAEAAVIIGVLMFVGRPAAVEATSSLGDLQTAEDDKIVELLVLDDKLFNNKTGTPYLYDAEIYVHVKRKYADRVVEELEQFQNEIKTEIAAIWKTSDPHQFQEPKNESLTRKVYALLDERFGLDQKTSEPIVTKCIVNMGVGLRVDS